MKFKQFMEMYDNWNGITKVNDNNLNTIVIGQTYLIMEGKVAFESNASITDYNKLFEMEVVSFGFYDNEFCVRVR